MKKKIEKLSLSATSQKLTKDEMKKIMAGSDGCGLGLPCQRDRDCWAYCGEVPGLVCGGTYCIYQ